MKQLNCIAIDDEPLALAIISSFCERRGGVELTCFSNPEEGFKAIIENNPDLVFLDIEMNGLTGIEIARTLRKEVLVIFTTAYMEYALEGFNLDAVDFLHKPFSFERFQEAVDKAAMRIDYREMLDSQKQILVKQDYSNVPIRMADILYIEAMENYSRIFLSSGKTVTAHNTLKSLAEQLDSTRFVRIHKSYIVARASIVSFNRQSVLLASGVTLPVGRKFADSLT